MIEPNCDMPWEIYLDWLQEQGYEDLRFINQGCLVTTFMLDCLFLWSGESEHGYCGEVHNYQGDNSYGDTYYCLGVSGDGSLEMNRLDHDFITNYGNGAGY